MAIGDYSTTPGSNTSISGINIGEGCNPSVVNDAFRQLMADLATYKVTITGGPYVTSLTTDFLRTSNNLSDVLNVVSARTNIGAAPLASPNFTGTPTVPTAAVANNTTQAASCAFVQTALGTGISFQKVAIQQFTANGTYTPSPSMAFAIVEVVPGGGGGGGCGTAYGAGGSGGAGGFAKALVTAAQVGTSQAVTVGAGGAGGTAGTNSGSAGGTSSFGSLLSANGGSGGGGASSGAGSSNSGGAGGSATVSTGTTMVAITGQAGSFGANFSGVGNFHGPGGSGPYGGGAPVYIVNTGLDTAGFNASGYGAGGSGASQNQSSGTARAGGNGADGIVIVTEYCTTPALGGGGSGGIAAYIPVSGSSVSATIGDGYNFNGATGAAKTLNLPVATGSLGIVESLDGDGDAETNAITAVPNGSDVIYGGQDQVATNYGTGGWRDIAIGYWTRLY